MRYQIEFRAFLINELKITSCDTYISRLKYFERQKILPEINEVTLNCPQQLEVLLNVNRDAYEDADLKSAGRAYILFINQFKYYEIQSAENEPNTSEYLATARINQFSWRQELLKKHDAKCCLTSIATTVALIASHIKPFRLCSPEEQYDQNNGLILLASVDKLFDRGLLTFNNEGEVIRSSLTAKKDFDQILHNNFKLTFELNESQKSFLAFHRNYVFMV